MNQVAEDVRAFTMGYSGNSSIEGAADVIVLTPNDQFAKVASAYFIEAKSYSGERGKRITLQASGGDSFTDQLEELVENTPEYAQPILALKLDHCELVLFMPQAFLEEAQDRADGKDVESNHPFVPRTTDTGNVSIRKPETDEWPTARSGRSNVEVICESLGVDYE
jgi:hypothetical protein